MVRTSMLLLAVAVLASGCEIRKGKSKGDGVCVASCLNRSCGDPNGCGGYCTACPGSGICVDSVCVDASEETCWPAWGECGWDGCGGWLGSCYADEYCAGNWCYSDDDWEDDPPAEDPDSFDPDPYDPDPYDPDPYECEPDCSWGCGDDGCGGWCGDC